MYRIFLLFALEAIRFWFRRWWFNRDRGPGREVLSVAFTLPDFNLLCASWEYPNLPLDAGTATANIPCQKYILSRAALEISEGTFTEDTWPTVIRMPLSAEAVFLSTYILEVPQGSGRYYLPRAKERMHEGFPNEYFAIIVEQCDIERFPILRDVEAWYEIPVSILLENGGRLLLENGTALKLE